MSSPEAQALLDSALKQALAKANPEQRKLLLRMHFLMEQQEAAVKEKNHDLVIKLVGDVDSLVKQFLSSAEKEQK